MRYLTVVAILLLVSVPLAAGGTDPGLAQLERSIKAELNGGPHGAVVRSVHCEEDAGLAQCVVTSVRGTQIGLRAPVEDGTAGVVREPVSG